MTQDEKELIATIKISIISGVVEMDEENLLNLVKKAIEEAEKSSKKRKPLNAARFYSKELLDQSNEPPSEEEVERLHKEIDEWTNRTNKFYRSSEDE